MIRIVSVHADAVGSKLIRWGTGSKSSHVAVLFDCDKPPRGTAFHSYGKGPQIGFVKPFLDFYTIVDAVHLNYFISPEDEETIFQYMADKLSVSPYDYPAMAFWTWRSILKKAFGIPATKSNYWQKKNSYLCTEIIPVFVAALRSATDRFQMNEKDLSMETPDGAIHWLLESGLFKRDKQWIDLANACK